MEQEVLTLGEQTLALWNDITAGLTNLRLPSRQIQIGILVVLFGLSWLIARWLAPKLYDWMRSLEGWPKWRLRVLVVLHQRMQLIVFTLLAWTSVAAMAQIYSFPSRRYILALVATIATALLLAGFASRLIRNRPLRRIVRWGLWIYIVLYYLGFAESAANFLDAVAVQFGDFRLSLLAVLKALVVTGVLFMLARLASGQASASIRENSDISPSMRVLAIKAVQILLFGAAFFIGLKAIGFDLTGLAVLSGAIGVGLGFGLQKVVSNLVSGVIILLDKSIKPGDVISLGETFGWIDTLGARYTSVVTRDGREYLIPNEDLITGQVVNWSHTDNYVRLDISFGASYHDDPHQVRKLAVEAAKSVDRVLTRQAPVCHITGFGDSAVDYVLRFWISDPSGGLTNIRGNVYLALWDTFWVNGISIPFPQREVRMLGETPAAVAEKANE